MLGAPEFSMEVAERGKNIPIVRGLWVGMVSTFPKGRCVS